MMTADETTLTTNNKITTTTTKPSSDMLNTPPPEQQEQDPDTLLKQYESMSYNEMSQRLAENYKQLSEILGNRISLPSSATTTDDSQLTTDEDHVQDSHEDDDDDKHVVIVEDNLEIFIKRTDLDLETKKKKLTKLFLKSVSSGDVDRLREFLALNGEEEWIDMDAKDEDGTTPLIYAACFGKFEIAQALLLAGAKIDVQDSHGWSALMWATTNNHEKIVKLLLEHGASATTKSTKGRTVFDFVANKNDSTHTKLADIIITNSKNSSNRDSISSLSTTTSSSEYRLTDENYESFLNLDNENRPKLIEEYLLSAIADTTDSDEDDEDYTGKEGDDDEDDGGEEEDEEDDSTKEFNWDKCMPDQMFVFGADNLAYILDTVITKLTLPVRNVQEIFLPANVVFLSARFAHYYSSAELAEDVMEGALSRISSAIKGNTQNVHILSYWMTNITRLLYYLKKDVELVVATAEYQLRLSELISETYNYMVNDIGKRITVILEPAMLEHDPIGGMMEQVDFVDDWQRFFRRSNRQSFSGGEAMSPMQRSSSQMSANAVVDLTPKSITQLLSSTYYVLQSYEVHSTIIIQALAQFLHFLSCELFNLILSKKKYLCRSKAVCIRMNLSVIEEWIRNNNLPATLLTYLNPSIQLVQLLQCVSQLDTVASFQSTIKMFDSINTLQIRRCVVNYRYETNEIKLPEEVEKYVNQTVEEQIRLKQAKRQQSDARRKSVSLSSQSLRRSLSMNRSGSESGNSIMNTIITSITPATPITVEEPASIKEEEEEASQQEEKGTEEETEEETVQEEKETRDSKFMLPFFVPTTAQLSHTTTKDSLMPVIPEDWMDKLDSPKN